jgi:hypothetical protein
MGVALRLHRQKTAVLVDLKSELAIEAFGDRKIGNGEMKPVDRMNAEFAGTTGWPDSLANGGHGRILSFPIALAGRFGRWRAGFPSMLTQDRSAGQDQRARALPPADDGSGAGSNGAVGLASGAATTVAGFGFFRFAGGGGAGAG